MTTKRDIRIEDRVYRINPAVDRYQIDLRELGDLRMRDIPPHSHLEILGIRVPLGAIEVEHYGLNAGDEGVTDDLEVYGGASWIPTDDDRERLLSRLRRAFPDMDPLGEGFLRNPHISTSIGANGKATVHLFLNLKFRDAPDKPVRQAVLPFIEGYERLEKPMVRLFICHASEDKASARALATAMAKLGADVWFDEWEIRVGDSIVQKINSALDTISHLVIILSHKSVMKPWVQKELSSALMNQLSVKTITVLPVRLDDCHIPPILADIRYADARGGMEAAVTELGFSLFGRTLADH